MSFLMEYIQLNYFNKHGAGVDYPVGETFWKSYCVRRAAHVPHIISTLQA